MLQRTDLVDTYPSKVCTLRSVTHSSASTCTGHWDNLTGTAKDLRENRQEVMEHRRGYKVRREKGQSVEEDNKMERVAPQPLVARYTDFQAQVKYAILEPSPETEQ